MTSEADRRLLLRLAREAIAAHVGRLLLQSATRDPQSAMAGVLTQPGGAFVTLHKHGDLRGCIGHIEPTEPLGKVVPRCAVAACSSDPRFLPIAPAELEEIDIEISLLGRHGLVVERGWQRGLLLPQVATERKWDADAFLAHTCQKAGLPRDAWRHGVSIWRFEAEVFGER
jgi:AMMECR1 domain-containing protein